MSTFEPRPPYSDAELAALYPPELKLQLVQVLLRHGERTPVNARFSNAGLPAFWPYCASARHFRSAILEPDANQDPFSITAGTAAGADPKISALAWKRRLETFARDSDHPVIAAGPRGELDAICDFGQLTDRGRETTTALGRRLRHLYIDRLGFLPGELDAAALPSLYLRATPIPRALESLHQTLHGLYPPTSRSPDLPDPTILQRPIGDETLFPNEGSCRRFAVLARAFADRAAKRWNDSDDMAFLTKRLGRWMPEDSPRVAVDAHPRLSGLMDTINATAAHGPETRLPSEFYDPKVKQIIEKIGVEEWYDGYKESIEYRTLGVGGLLGDIVARMVGSAEGSTADGQYEISESGTPIRFGMSGCHDTTLAGTLASLGAYNQKAWPPFTSHIAIELFRQANAPPPPPASIVTTTSWLPSIFGGSSAPKPGTSPPGIGYKRTSDLSANEKQTLQGYYVRIRYNDQPVTIPGCRSVGNHLEGDESFCTLVS
jgi:acid phosphatase